MKHDRLLPAAIFVVQAVRILNAIAVALILLVLAGTFIAAAAITGQLHAKYGTGADVAAIMTFLRVTLVFALPVGIVVERLLRPLRAILATVSAGEPFAPANAARLRTIGWMLLALQVVDLAYGGVVLLARHLRIDYVGWQPSFTGWIAVLVAFVLVRVFAAGTTMRDDLAGTV